MEEYLCVYTRYTTWWKSEEMGYFSAPPLARETWEQMGVKASRCLCLVVVNVTQEITQTSFSFEKGLNWKRFRNIPWINNRGENPHSVSLSRHMFSSNFKAVLYIFFTSCYQMWHKWSNTEASVKVAFAWVEKCSNGWKRKERMKKSIQPAEISGEDHTSTFSQTSASKLLNP